jgi:hypothetical protein
MGLRTSEEKIKKKKTQKTFFLKKKSQPRSFPNWDKVWQT